MFGADPKARADLKPGTLYAIKGQGGWIYYGQVTDEKALGVYRHRTREVCDPNDVLAHRVMAIFNVAFPSITRALRAGIWKKLGRFAISSDLIGERTMVQWPVGTLTVTVWGAAGPRFETKVDDPAIQDAELMAVWDAQHHVPARLTADFGAEEAEWHVGGLIWRERKIKEEMARRFPDSPSHQLPADWVPTEAR